MAQRKRTAGKKRSQSDDTLSEVPAPFGVVAESQLGALVSGCFSLMQSVRTDLPEERCKSPLLEHIVLRQPGLYSHFLGRIMCLSSVQAAAQILGIVDATLYAWVRAGATDLSRNRDTFFARFTADVRRAHAFAVSQAEMAAGKKNPERYLTHGAGRSFTARCGLWHPGDAPPPIPGEDQLDPLPELEANPDKANTPGQVDQALVGALRELDRLGITRDPAFVSSARQQYGIPADGASENGRHQKDDSA